MTPKFIRVAGQLYVLAEAEQELKITVGGKDGDFMAYVERSKKGDVMQIYRGKTMAEALTALAQHI